jgi:hypothetical protein
MKPPTGRRVLTAIVTAPNTRLTHRRLEPGGAFWRGQAERLLSAYVWSEGKAPANGRLTMHDVSREDLEVVARWEFD